MTAADLLARDEALTADETGSTTGSDGGDTDVGAVKAVRR